MSLVPEPQSLKLLTDKSGFELGEKFTVKLPPDAPLLESHFGALGQALQLSSNCQLELVNEATASGAHCVVSLDPDMSLEEYQLTVHPKQIHIRASDVKGVSHATATLLQLLGSQNGKIPAVEINDRPDCSYRSFMIDLGRNPHSLECLMETVDLLWFYKVDSFHLHLTDDQRFAFPSKAFPKLASERGKITWEEFAKLEQYAHARGVTLIPELEVPGHSALLCRTYPEVFGKNSTEVAQLPSSRAAIKVLLDEMIELFPSSPYVHVGGDEAFGVPEDQQRDLINELHAYLKQKGRKTLVWEGPRLGTGGNKVNEEVIHINWRTINFPADKMLAAGYPVVNAAWDPLYLVDHYPRNNFTMASPEHIYETLDLYRFKHFNPGIPSFSKPIVVKPNEQVIGFCMPWWEGREENYFPMVVPRTIPMAAVAWKRPTSRDYLVFGQQTDAAEEVRQRGFYPVTIEASPLVLAEEGVFHDQTTITLTSSGGGAIHYTLDGSKPTQQSPRYEQAIAISDSLTLRAAAFVDDQQVAHGSRKKLVHLNPVENLALGKPVTTTVPSGPPFSAARLTDGGTGQLDYFLGYPTEPEPILITIDLQQVVPINQVVVHSFANNCYESYEVLVSPDGEHFEKVASRVEKPEELTSEAVHDFAEQPTRYVRIATHGCKNYVFDSFSKLTEIQVFGTKQQKNP